MTTMSSRKSLYRRLKVAPTSDDVLMPLTIMANSAANATPPPPPVSSSSSSFSSLGSLSPPGCYPLPSSASPPSDQSPYPDVFCSPLSPRLRRLGTTLSPPAGRLSTSLPTATPVSPPDHFRRLQRCSGSDIDRVRAAIAEESVATTPPPSPFRTRPSVRLRHEIGCRSLPVRSISIDTGICEFLHRQVCMFATDEDPPAPSTPSTPPPI